MGAPGSIACGLFKDVRAGNYFKKNSDLRYLIHKDLKKPSMIRASERESEGRSEQQQQINQSDSLILDPSYEHTSASLGHWWLSRYPGIRGIYAPLHPHKNSPRQSAIFSDVQIGLNYRVHPITGVALEYSHL